MYTVTVPPASLAKPVVDILHGVPVSDPYRWLEDPLSPETRHWIEDQGRYTRTYLDGLASRPRIYDRVRELLDVETYDSFLKAQNRYFFRRRLVGQEQPAIYLREGAEGEDCLLVDPAARGTGEYAAVKPLAVSTNGSLLLYEVKQGGERMGRFEILDVVRREVVPDRLRHGYLRGFAFAPDARSFYYVHEPAETQRPDYHSVFHHVLGTDFSADREIFRAGGGPKVRLALVSGIGTLGFVVYRFLEKTYTDFYLWRMGSTGAPIPVLRDADYTFAPRLIPGRILAVTDESAPNRRIVELQPRRNQNPRYFDLVRECDAEIHSWTLTREYMVASYVHNGEVELRLFDLFGKDGREIPCNRDTTVRILASSPSDDEVLLERESFASPMEIVRCSLPTGQFSSWARRSLRFDGSQYLVREVSFPSKDGTSIPMSLVARPAAFIGGIQDVIMTSYGGYGRSVTPQFSVFVAFLLDQGCAFALPRIRGGSEFGAAWHHAAKRTKRQVAFDDFLSAAEWLIETERTTSKRLVIFGGSNSGLLVAAVLTQRPELFRAVLCLAPLADMLRYHLFDNAHIWQEEFGTADDPDDFTALSAYSPYHRVRANTSYPATMIVSGGADQNCNPLHARKLTAQLQAANSSEFPILLDYSEMRGHSPVLPLHVRLAALTDRLAFVMSQLGISC